MKRQSSGTSLCVSIFVAGLIISHATGLRTSRSAAAPANQTLNPQTSNATRLGIFSVAARQPATGNEPAKLISSGSILDGNGPISFPQKIISGPARTLYLLDVELSNIFLVNSTTRAVNALCSPRLPVRPSDASVDNSGNVWILDQPGRQVASFDKQCHSRTSFTPRNPATGVQLNAFGEVVLVTPNAQTLFDVYSPDGKFLRSFGQAFDYKDQFANIELNSGHLLADPVGGFYFSFIYPPLVRHYARDGRLLAEFKPELDVAIQRPQIMSHLQGVSLTISSKYQIGVLDVALDGRGRLVLLLSGETKYQALHNGSRNLAVTNGRGQILAKYEVDSGPFNRLTAGNGLLYLLRNRGPLRLDKFALR